MADEKMKKARTRKIVVSPLLAIDSPGVMFVLHGFDELRQVPGVIFPGGGSGEPVPTPTPPREPPLSEPPQFTAYCSLSHPPEDHGVTVDGHWFGGIVASFDDASRDALGHPDGGAQVFFYVNASLVGPVIQP